MESNIRLQTSQHDPQTLQISSRAGLDVFEDAHNAIDDSVAAANIQPDIAAGVTYTIQAFHGILQTVVRQAHFEEVAAMKENRTLRGRRTRRYLLSSLSAKVGNASNYRNAQCSWELDRIHRDAVFFRLSLDTALV